MADDGDVWALELVLVLLLVRVVVLVVVLVPVLVLLLRRRISVLLYVTGTEIRGRVASSSSTISFQSRVLGWRVDWWGSSSSVLSSSSSFLGEPVTIAVGFRAGGPVSSIMVRMPLVQWLMEISRGSLHSFSSSNSIASVMGVGGGVPGG